MGETAQPAFAGDPEVRRKLGLDAPPSRRRWLRVLVALVVVAALAGGFVLWRRHRQKLAEPHYVTAAVEQRDLEVTVNATGSLNALETVDVGAEASGRILRVLVDFNDAVTKGQVLAELDTEQLEARLDEARAQLQSANAAVKSARASAREAKQSLARMRDLAQKGLASSQQLEAAEAQAERADANVGTALAQAAIADAGVKAARTNRDKTTIRAPIDGIVLARNVEAGQTLQSTFQVPVLFRIAKDLRDMELRVAIDEADVGRVREGQSASFTVDAYGGRTFPSKVVALRNVPTVEQNVVTYEAVLAVDNDDRMLRPGMTATALIVTDHLAAVTVVPNAALRFTPPDIAKKEKAEIGQKGKRKRMQAQDEVTRHRVWLLRDGQPTSVEVTIGKSDGTSTEVVGGELTPGTELLVDLLEDGG